MTIKIQDVAIAKIMEKNFEKALSIGNKYSFLNANLFPMLSKEERDTFTEFQDHGKKMFPLAQENVADVYPLFPKIGENNMIQRMNPYKDTPGSCKTQMLLNLAGNMVSPELDVAVTASGILVGNSLLHNPNRPAIQDEALEGIYNGTKIGGIGITELEHGSDAVNMKTQANIAENGDITYNGIKIYTTNGPVADIFSTYGVTDISDPRRTMMLTMFQRGDEGLIPERLVIPGAAGLAVGKVTYNNVTVPKDRMLAPPGEGYKRLFRGLTPERIGIISGSLAGIWNSLTHGVIYTQLRHQFGKPLFKYQGISFKLAELYARTSAYTAFAFQIADAYDKTVGVKIHHGETPNATDESAIAIAAAQGKYLTAKFSHEIAYEVAQMMGGRGALDEPLSNCQINRLENGTRITEVLGGHRNIQLLIATMGLRGTSAMAITSNIKKEKRKEGKIQAQLAEMYVARAQKMLAADGALISEKTRLKLESTMNKHLAAVEAKDKREAAFFSSGLVRLIGTAGKEIYKAKKKAA